MVRGQDPGRSLAERLRDLRTARWPGLRVKQSDLASALGVSVPTVSSWESLTNPVLPPIRHLESMASFYASRRSMTEGPPHVPLPADLTGGEQQDREGLWGEFRKMRVAAQRAAPPKGAAVSSPLESDLWTFPTASQSSSSAPNCPRTCSAPCPTPTRTTRTSSACTGLADLDSLFELHGHLRAVNPRNQVDLRRATNLTNDDLTSHLVILGGVGVGTRWPGLVLGRLVPARPAGNRLGGAETALLRGHRQRRDEAVQPSARTARRDRVPVPVRCPMRTWRCLSGRPTRRTRKPP